MVSYNLMKFPYVRGGLLEKYDVQEGEGVMENWTNLDRGREGVKNPGNFADIICTWPLSGIPDPSQLSNTVEYHEKRL